MLALLLQLAVTSPAGSVSHDTALIGYVARLEQGDESARNRLASLARAARERAVAAGSDADLWRDAAVAHLALAKPLSSPTARTWTEREALWRPGLTEALRELARLDSATTGALEVLQSVAPYPLLWHDAPREAAYLRRAATRGVALSAPLAIALVQLELELGDVDAASGAMTHLSPSISPSLRRYLDAEIAFARGDTITAQRAYAEGLALVADSASVEMYLRHVAWLAPDSLVRTWRTLPPSAFQDSVSQFWIRRDLADVRPAGSRLTEQFRRWRAAISRYRWSSNGWAVAHPPFVEVPDGKRMPAVMMGIQGSALQFLVNTSPGSQVLDDRGRLLMRHGLPAHTITGIGEQANERETLAWSTSAGLLIVGFSKPDVGAFETEVTAVRLGMLVRGFPQGDAMSICQIDARMCVLAGMSSQQGRRIGYTWGATAIRGQQVRESYQAMHAAADSTDGQFQHFDKDLDAVVQAFGVEGGRALIVVAVPMSSLRDHHIVDADNPRFPMRVTIALGDPRRGTMPVFVDTVRRFALPPGAPRSGYVSMLFEIPVPLGTWTAGVVVSDTGRTAGSRASVAAIPVVGFNQTLQLSDILVGRANSQFTWSHAGEDVPLNPTGAWRRDEPATVFYEVGSQVIGREYETRIELFEVAQRDARPKLQISFRSTATTTRSAIAREFDLRELKRGSYRLAITITDQLGATARRERRLNVQ